MSFRNEVGSHGQDTSRLGGLTQEGTVISNMPLLFADGYPTCLETMTESQLEKFIPFMIHCALGINPYELEHTRGDQQPLAAPPWWPSSVKFKFPLVKPRCFSLNGKWRKTLRSLVHRCYVHHECQFMLNFSDELVTTPASLMKFIDLCDGTTELRDKRTSKLLVTFRNENRAYDKVADSPRRHMQLLPRTPRSEKPPLFTDIYLCESCDAEFETLREVKNHEVSCHKGETGSAVGAGAGGAGRPEPPDDQGVDDQGRFLTQLGLLDSRSSSQLPCTPKRGASKRRHHAGASMSFTRCSSVPISSPMGRALLRQKPRAFFTVTPLLAERLERHCSKPVSPKGRPTLILRSRWKAALPENPWVHTYSFSANQRRLRYATLDTGLDRRSRYLLAKCTRLEVVAKKLTDMEIKMYTKAREPAASPVRRELNEADIPMARKCTSWVQREPAIPLIDLSISSDEDVPTWAPGDLSTSATNATNATTTATRTSAGNTTRTWKERKVGGGSSNAVLLHQLTRSSSASAAAAASASASAAYRLDMANASTNNNNVNVKIEPLFVQKRLKSQSSGPSENRLLRIPYLARRPGPHKFFNLMEPDSKGKLKELNKIKESNCVPPKVNWSVKCSERR